MVSIFKKNIFRKLNDNYIFEMILIAIYFSVGIIGWKYSYSYSGFGVILLTLVLVFIFNDFKYFIPASLNLLFSYNLGYESETFPIEIAIYAGLFIAIAIMYTLFNKSFLKIKSVKSYIGFLLLAISCIIPIFWNSVITDNNKILYLIYFTWLLYLVIYFMFEMNMGKRSLRMVIFSMCFLAVLISSECFLKVLELHNKFPDKNIFSLSYYLGWGLCNEAGIMICFCLPFIFYFFIKSNNIVYSIMSIIFICFSIGGIALTGSRGSILFGGIETIILIILMIIFSKKRITNIILFLLLSSLIIVYIQVYFGIGTLVNDIISNVYGNGFYYEDRLVLWKSSINLWKQNGLTVVFGSGIVSEIDIRNSFTGVDNVYLVYHSTIFEALAFGGILGVASLLIHFFEKYKQLMKKEKAFLFVMLVGYVVVDLYGMIDNTYGMYYYMIPLIFTMAALSRDNDLHLF